MVSNLYKAEKFYEKQNGGSIAKPYFKVDKLNKDRDGFFLFKSKSNGNVYKQRVKKDDYVYTRQEGVTKYSVKKDRARIFPKTQTIRKESGTKHKSKAHMSDRESISTDRIYKQ